MYMYVHSQQVNISNTWTLPQDGFSVFYRFFRDKISWFEADAVCQFHHANLVKGNFIFFLFSIFLFFFSHTFFTFYLAFSFLADDFFLIIRNNITEHVVKIRSDLDFPSFVIIPQLSFFPSPRSYVFQRNGTIYVPAMYK